MEKEFRSQKLLVIRRGQVEWDLNRHAAFSKAEAQSSSLGGMSKKPRGPKGRSPGSAGRKRSTFRAAVQAGIDSGEAEVDVIGRIRARIQRRAEVSGRATIA